MAAISDMDIRKLDLNLLVSLDALLTEGSVTRAAQRVHLSQPAMSAALGRLRDAFGDTLLIRTSSGMKPTQKAKELIGPIRAALESIQNAIAPRAPIDPGRLRRSFSISASEYVSFVVMPTLMAELRKSAPDVTLAVTTVDSNDPFKSLRDGTTDLVIAAHFGRQDSIRKSDLFQDTCVCIARKMEGVRKRRLTLKQFLNTPQVVIRGQAGGIQGFTDNLSQRMGVSRRVVISVSDFLAVPHIIMETDLIMVIAHKVALALEKHFPIQILPYPVRREYFKVSQYWHQRADNDSAHRWLRQIIQQVCRDTQTRAIRPIRQ